MASSIRRWAYGAVRIDWRGARAAIRRAAWRGSLGLPIGAIAFALFCLANYASLHRNVETARAHVAQAFATGALQDEDYLDGNTGIGRHQYNDCLILWQAIDQRDSDTALTVSPLSTPAPTGETRCSSLRHYVAGLRTDPPTFYHRYIHGHTTFLRFLLPVLSVEAIRNLYHTILTLLVLSGIAVALIGLARGRRPEESLFWLIVFLALSRWFGLETYGQSLGHAPADMIAVGFCLLLALCGVGRGISRRTALVSAAIFGALTAMFEFLTGGIPLGMAIVIGGLPFAVHAARDDDPAAFVLDAWAAFCAAVITCLALKVALVIGVFGADAMTDSALQLKMRLGLDPSRGETSDLGLPLMAKKLAKGISGIAPGMHVMAGAMVALSIGIGAWGALRLLRAPIAPVLRRRTIAVLISNLAIVAMLALFWEHTMIHAWFMERTLVWTIASGFALFAFACQARRVDGLVGAR